MDDSNQRVLADFDAERAELQAKRDSLKAKLDQVERALEGLELTAKLLRSPSRRRQRNGTMSNHLREIINEKTNQVFTKDDVEIALRQKYPDQPVRNKTVSIGLSRLAEEGVIVTVQRKQGRSPARYCRKEDEGIMDLLK